jgi:hypothetical protein
VTGAKAPAWVSKPSPCLYLCQCFHELPNDTQLLSYGFGDSCRQNGQQLNGYPTTHPTVADADAKALSTNLKSDNKM